MFELCKMDFWWFDVGFVLIGDSGVCGVGCFGLVLLFRFTAGV